MTQRFIDTHCHLDNPCFDPYRESIVKSCESKNIEIINPAILHEDWQRILNISKKYKIIKPALGLHPLFAKQHKPEHLKKLEEITSISDICALGEIGLDFYNGRDEETIQTHFFTQQLEMAKDYQLPVLIHCRKAHDEMIDILEEINLPHGGIIHAFSGNIQQAEKYIRLGFMLGFGGISISPKAKKYHNILKQIPKQNLVLETDAPDMKPYFSDLKFNTPENLPRICKELAEILSISTDELSDICYKNSRKLFNGF